MSQGKIRILIITGMLETHLQPVPPVADGAAQWNVFRLAEVAAQDDRTNLEIHVLSPCESTQLDTLGKYPVQAFGKYHHVVFHSFELAIYRRFLRHLFPLRILVRRTARLPDLLSWFYLQRAKEWLTKLQPDVVIINDRPQYIRFLRSFMRHGRLWLMLRYPLGESARFLGQLDGILINSAGMKKYVQQFLVPGGPLVMQIPNTLDDEYAIPELDMARFHRVEKVVLFAGRLIPEKGVRELLLAFRKVYSQLPGCRLWIFGTLASLTPYQDEILRLAGQFPPGVVDLKGYIPNQQMPKYYRQASVAVFPSLPGIYLESFGMVALEAMRCGTPVIASRQPGFEEQVISGETGFLVDDPRNVDALSEAIAKIVQDPALAHQMGRAGYQRSLDYRPTSGLQALEEALCSQLICHKSQ